MTLRTCACSPPPDCGRPVRTRGSHPAARLPPHPRSRVQSDSAPCLRIHETERGESLLPAPFIGHASHLDDRSLAVCLLKFPLMTWKIVAGIHREPRRLWVKGARVHRSPPAPKTARYRDEAGAFVPGE
ncbi:DUF1365 family protein [Mesorhizobium sp. CAU 1732]|uniref:DUF1365 family protein n=1 Tax=Mesorhizobium sp. CAU 1732 TaxID=3140358 RepID=UPI003260369F